MRGEVGYTPGKQIDMALAWGMLAKSLSDIRNAQQRLFLGRDIGGCLQCIEFALQQLESAKAKLMK